MIDLGSNPDIVMLAFLELVGLMLSIYCLIYALTKGRNALKIAGGGLIGNTLLYLLGIIVNVIIVIGLKFSSTMVYIIYEQEGIVASNILDAISIVALFGISVNLFAIFWTASENLNEFKEKFT